MHYASISRFSSNVMQTALQGERPVRTGRHEREEAGDDVELLQEPSGRCKAERKTAYGALPANVVKTLVSSSCIPRVQGNHIEQ